MRVTFVRLSSNRWETSYIRIRNFTSNRTRFNLWDHKWLGFVKLRLDTLGKLFEKVCATIISSNMHNEWFVGCPRRRHFKCEWLTIIKSRVQYEAPTWHLQPQHTASLKKKINPLLIQINGGSHTLFPIPQTEAFTKYSDQQNYLAVKVAPKHTQTLPKNFFIFDADGFCF